MPGPARQYPADELFELVYNGGQRRTKAQAVDAWSSRHPGEDPPTVATLAKYASADDWQGRMSALDAEARTAGDAKIAELIRAQRVETIKVSVTVMRLFARRFSLPEGDPARLDAADVDHAQWVVTAKLFELLTGGATERRGEEGATSIPLEEIEAELEEIEVRALQREQERTPTPRELPPVLDDQARRLVTNPTQPARERVKA